MTTEQQIEIKAKELVDKFKEPTQEWDEREWAWVDNIDIAKECSIICIDEIISVLNEIEYSNHGQVDDCYGQLDYEAIKEKIKSL